MWIAGLPAAVCGWKLEAEKHAGDNPPAEPGAGYNLAYTAGRGIIQCIASDASRRSIFAAAVFLCFYGIGGKIGVSMPPAGYFLCAQKVPRRRHQTNPPTQTTPPQDKTSRGGIFPVRDCCAGGSPGGAGRGRCSSCTEASPPETRPESR